MSTENCGLEITVLSMDEEECDSGEAFLVIFKIKNLFQEDRKIEISSKTATYITNDGEQLEEDFFLTGRFYGRGLIKGNAYVKSGLWFLKKHLENVSIGDILFLTVSLPDERLVLTTRFEHVQNENGPAWTLTDYQTKQLDDPSRHSPGQSDNSFAAENDPNSPPTKNEVLTKALTKGIERLEALEEKLGISLENLTVRVHLHTNDIIHVLGEIHLYGSNVISEGIKIVATAYGEDGHILGTESEWIDPETFAGFDVFEINLCEEQIALRAKRIRVFVKGG